MTNVAELVDRCQHLGAEFIVNGERVRVKAPNPLPPDLLEQLRSRKAEIRAYLERPKVSSIADGLEACLLLGRLLGQRHIPFVVCGITGNRCRACAGVPCLGSRAPDEDSNAE